MPTKPKKKVTITPEVKGMITPEYLRYRSTIERLVETEISVAAARILCLHPTCDAEMFANHARRTFQSVKDAIEVSIKEAR